jgi:hypothetical protein
MTTLFVAVGAVVLAVITIAVIDPPGGPTPPPMG